MAKDNFPSTELTGPATDAFAVVPNDTTDMAVKPRAIYVGGAGDIVATFPSGDVTFKAVPVGTTLPIRPSRIKTASTATLMIGLL